MKYILSVDQSTAGTKAIIFDTHGSIIHKTTVLHRQIYPSAGWVEHDPMEIYENVKKAVKDVITTSGIEKEEILVLSITNQRETTVLWDEHGQPLYNAIVWQCNRAQPVIQEKRIAEKSQYIYHATGLTLSPYFSAAKAKWITQNVSHKKPYFGTIDSWLVYKLTGLHVTDYSNAARTQLFNIHSKQWDEDIRDIFGLSALKLPKVISSNTIAGYTTLDGYFASPIPVSGLIGDSNGALFGQCCFEKGTGKATLGTGTSVMVNIGDLKLSNKGLVTSIAWGLDEEVEYVLEGNINSSGDTIKWLAEKLQILPTVGECEEYAASSNDGVYLVPAFVGVGAPYWDSGAKAIICGLSRSSNKHHIIRAGMESIAYQINDIVTAMCSDGAKLLKLNVDGGATANTTLMQFMADIIGKNIVISEIEEASALGSAYTAGMAMGIWKDKHELRQKIKKEYRPAMPKAKSGELYKGWSESINMVCSGSAKIPI